MPTEEEIRQRDRKSKEELERLKREQEEKLTNRKIAADLVKTIVPKGSFKLNDLGWYTRLMGNPKVNMELSTFRPGNMPDTDLAADKTSGSLIESIFSANNGVIQVNYLPTIGRQKVVVGSSNPFTFTVDSAINDAISRLKSQLDKRNSRISTYANDVVGRYIVCGIDGIHVPMKLLGLALQFYDLAHAEYPDMACQFVQAFGFDYNNFTANLPNYRNFYSQWVSQFNESIPIIADMSFIDRRLFLAGKCVADSEDRMAQVVVFHPMAMAYMTNSDDIVRYVNINYIQYNAFTSKILGTYRALTKGATWKPFIRDLRGGVPEDKFLKMPLDYASYDTEVSVIPEVMGQFHNLDTYPDLVSNAGIFNGKQVLLSSLNIRGDTFENVCQGWTPSDFAGAAIGNFGDLMLRPGICQYILTGSAAVATINTVVSRFDAVLSKLRDNKLVNRYNRDVDGSTMIDTRLSATHLAMYRTVGSDTPTLDIDDNNTSVSIVDSIFVVPVEYATELVYSIAKVMTLEEYEKAKSEQGFPATGYGYHGIFAGRHVDSIFSAGALVSLYNWGVWFSTTVVIASPISDTYLAGMWINDYAAQHIDWIPLHLKSIYTSDFVDLELVIGELCDYYTISGEILGRLNYQAALSEFTIDGASILKPLE